jgi:ADP-ribosylation factor-like protein 3
MEEAALELKSLLGEEKLAGVPLLVYANKQDLISAKEADEVSAILGLEAYTDRAVQVRAAG